MELVGKALAYREVDGGLRVVFRCTNKEEFDLLVSPTILRIPLDKLVRVLAKRPQGEQGALSRENALVHWEEL